MTLISKEEILEDIDELPVTMSVCVSTDECYGMRRMLDWVVEIIKNAEAKATNGVWRKVGDYGYEVRCSNCGMITPTEINDKGVLGGPPFCPYCGSQNVKE